MATIDEELNQIEKDLRTLKIEYEQYFGGGRQRPPTDTQWRVEQMIKRFGDRGGDMNFGQRFRLNNLAQTYAKYQDMWRKKVMQKEEGGGPRHFGAAAKAIEAERARVAARQAAAATPFAMSFSDPDREGEKVHSLYRKLIEARQRTGEQSGAPSLDDFERFVRQKTQELKQKKGCEEVEYTVSVEDGRVKLKAKVGS